MNKQLIARTLGAAMMIVIISLSLPACKKSSNSSSAAVGTVWFHLHTNIDTNEVDDTSALYRDANGRHFGLSVAQFYVSNVVLTNAQGSTYTIANAHVLKDIDSEQYVIGTAPIGVYTSVKFDIGLEDNVNGETPTAFTNTGYLPNSTMWYGNTTQGYAFMKILGFADTTTSQSGTNLVHFEYQIASAANRKTVTMPVRATGTYADYPVYTLLSGGITYIHVICDYGKLLSVIDFKTQDSTDTYTINPMLSATIANNIPNMFRYEE